MAKIRFKSTDPATIGNPPAGTYYVGVDASGLWAKNPAGTVTRPTTPTPVANLASTDDTAVLAASQGKALKDLIDALGVGGLADVDLTGLINGQILQYNSTSGNFEAVTFSGGGAVDSVNTQTGVVVLDTDDISEGVTNKYVTAAQKTKLDGIEAGATADQDISGKQDVLSEGAFVNGDKTKLNGIEANADVTDEANVKAALNGATITDAGVPASDDKILIQDTSDANNLKYVNVSDLPTGGGGGAVDSVAGKTGVVTLVKADVGLGSVDNTSDASKPVSTATQTALDAKQATLVSATNIKTVNGSSILGSGDLVVSGGGGGSAGQKMLLATYMTSANMNGAGNWYSGMSANHIGSSWSVQSAGTAATLDFTSLNALRRVWHASYLPYIPSGSVIKGIEVSVNKVTGTSHPLALDYALGLMKLANAAPTGHTGLSADTDTLNISQGEVMTTLPTSGLTKARVTGIDYTLTDDYAPIVALKRGDAGDADGTGGNYTIAVWVIYE